MGRSKMLMAIDPGMKGALAWVNDRGECHVQNMPDTPRGILDALREVFEGVGVEPSTEKVCYLEDVGKGMAGENVSALCKFARHNGNLEMALMALDVKIVKVLPKKWQKTMSIGKSTDCANKSEWKRKLKNKAEEMYPMFKVTLVNADALLMLSYAIQEENNCM